MFVAAIGFAAVAPSAYAAGAKKKAHATETEDAGPQGPRMPTVTMPSLVAPVIVDGEMLRYAYFSVALRVVDNAHKPAVMDKVPYLQDGFVREVHGPSIVSAADPTVIDEKALAERLLRVCDRIAGDGIVKEVELHNADEMAR